MTQVTDVTILVGQKLLGLETAENTYIGLTNEPALTRDAISLRLSASRFVIENPYRICDRRTLLDETIDCLIGMTVTDFNITKDVAITIILDSIKQITVSLRDEDFSSP